jgi:acetyl-CoA carboxylase carboxyltransferase component
VPGCWQSPPPSYDAAPAGREFTRDLVPAEESVGFDIHDVIDAIADARHLLRAQTGVRAELVTGFGLLAGQVVGFVANQPAVRAGCCSSTRRQGGPIHLVVRRLQHPAVYLCDVRGS